MYIGPDQVLPVGSLLGMLLGLIVSFAGRLVAIFRRIAGRSKSSLTEIAAPTSDSDNSDGTPR